MALYQVLVEWRDTISRQQGLNPSMVIPLDLLVRIAYRTPRSINELRQLSYILPEFLDAEANLSHLHELIGIVAIVTEDTTSNSTSVSTYCELVKRQSRNLEQREMPLYLNILRWSLISSAAIGWLTTVIRKKL